MFVFCLFFRYDEGVALHTPSIFSLKGVVYLNRSSGILLPISSLPSPYGIGTMGKAARDFVDFLVCARQKYWQILPICSTSYGDSPYASFSNLCGATRILSTWTCWRRTACCGNKSIIISTGAARPTVLTMDGCMRCGIQFLRKACDRLLAAPPAGYADFCRENAFWLPDYALFMALKDAHGGAPWSEWEPALIRREAEAMEDARRAYAADIEFWKAVQYLFFKQWLALKAYANERGVEIIGDLPIYVAADSVDVWSSPEGFQLDDTLTPTEVAGCPPDAFSATGQLWGNPLYDWGRNEKDRLRLVGAPHPPYPAASMTWSASIISAALPGITRSPTAARTPAAAAGAPAPVWICSARSKKSLGGRTSLPRTLAI